MKNQLIMLTAVLAALVSGVYAKKGNSPEVAQPKAASSSWFDSDSFKSLKDAALDTGKKVGAVVVSTAADKAAEYAKKRMNQALGQKESQADEVVVTPARGASKEANKVVAKTVAVHAQPKMNGRGSVQASTKKEKSSGLKALTNDQLYLKQQELQKYQALQVQQEELPVTINQLEDKQEQLQTSLRKLSAVKRKTAQQTAESKKLTAALTQVQADLENVQGELERIEDELQNAPVDLNSLERNLSLIEQEMDLRKSKKEVKDEQRREDRLEIYQDIVSRYNNEVVRYAGKNKTTVPVALEVVNRYNAADELAEENGTTVEQAIKATSAKSPRRDARFKIAQEVANRYNDAIKFVKANKTTLEVAQAIAERYHVVAEFAQQHDTTIEKAIKAVEHMTR